jgi:ubiquinone/menaquinone biosynthesis C-methylase UbiE
MKTETRKPNHILNEVEPTYLDVQAAVGITKHMGGLRATDVLHQLCHLETAREVLEVGCGIGVGPAYIAKRFECRVMAVDISEKMLSWAEQRAHSEGVLDRVSFRQADINELPFEDDCFDAVIVESVLAFVEDKEAAIRELIRVTKPGGYVGLNECYWEQTPTHKLLSHSVYIGTAIISEAEWRTIWEIVPLDEQVIQTYSLEAKREVRDRIDWIGWRYILSAWGRIFKMLFKDRSSIEAIKKQFETPAELINALRYGLFVGRKPS